MATGKKAEGHSVHPEGRLIKAGHLIVDLNSMERAFERKKGTGRRSGIIFDIVKVLPGGLLLMTK